jgi:hypothetical protein
MSRVFGPLTRYKLYERLDDNRDWAIDFGRPRTAVWDYVSDHYAAIQQRYGFDFMRGDMSHVQMRPGGVPDEIDDHYDPLRAVKRKINERAPYFGYFAESFLAEDNLMAYGSEIEHLSASEAEVTLGNLQSLVAGSDEFMRELSRYLKIAQTTPVTPAFTAITGDKDDPRFDHFHHHGEVARLFAGLFLPHLPLYYSLGWEQRDRHFSPAPNEYYTKLYVFQEREGPKSVSGPWRWGDNLDLFAAFQSVHRFAERMLGKLGGDAGAVWMGDSGLVSWLRPELGTTDMQLFIVNFGSPTSSVALQLPTGWMRAELQFAWPAAAAQTHRIELDVFELIGLAAGEVRCYRLVDNPSADSDIV